MKERRSIVAQLFIDMTRELDVMQTGRAGTRCDLTLIVLAILLGGFEGKPQSASKIAEAVEIPRKTVVRKLKELEARKSIVREKNGYIAAEWLHEHVPTLEAQQRLERLILDAAFELAKMATKLV